MTTPTEQAREAMLNLGTAAVERGEGVACVDCGIEQVVSGGLTITRLSGVMEVEGGFAAKPSMSESMVGIGLGFKVTWQNGTTELPKVGMSLRAEVGEKPTRTTVRDFPYIATILGNMIRKRTSLRLVE